MVTEGWQAEGVVRGMKLKVVARWPNVGLAGHFTFVTD